MIKLYPFKNNSGSTIQIGRYVIIFLLMMLLNSAVKSQELVFRNPVLKSGSAGQNGAEYLFSNVKTNVDAYVKIKGRSAPAVTLTHIDATSAGYDNAFQPELGRSGNITGIADWWMDFDIRFVNKITNQDTSLAAINMTALDVDGDNLTIREYVEFYRTKNSDVYNPSMLTKLLLSGGNSQKDFRYIAPLVNFPLVDSTFKSVMASCQYESRAKISVRVGAESLGLGTSNAGSRFYSLWFGSFANGAAGALPVKLSQFNASLANGKAVLNWTTDMERNVSHFTIERSTDGSSFTDAGIIFTEGDSEVKRNYSFRDPAVLPSKGVIYYRLKMVDLDGKVEYSALRTLKMGGVSDVKIQTFPNPVISGLRITIPNGWQNRKVVYELYSAQGQLLKRFENNNASQTETIQMTSYQPGTYVIKVANEQDIATERIVKAR